MEEAPGAAPELQQLASELTRIEDFLKDIPEAVEAAPSDRESDAA
jgi:hypothetical protein